MGRLRAVLVMAVAALVFAGTKTQAACRLETLANLPITMRGSQPITTVKINDSPVGLMIDSGAFFSSLTPTTATELNLHRSPAPFGMRVEGVGGQAVPDVATVSLKLSGYDLARVDFMVLAGTGYNVGGILGRNLLGHDVDFDFASGMVKLFRPHDCGGAPLAYWAAGKTINIVELGYVDDHQTDFTAEAYVNGQRIRVVFDTGASASVLTRRAAERVGIKMDGPEVVAAGYSIGVGEHMIRNWIAPVSSFRIGDEDIQRTRMRIADFEIAGYDMLLGADFFLSHHVFVAVDQRKLYFTYNGGPVFNLTTSATQTAAAPSEPTTGAAPSGADPKDAEDYSRQGSAFAAREDYIHAIASFDKAIAMAPSEARYSFQRASARLGARQLSECVADLDKAIVLKPDYVEALIMRGQLRLAEKKRVEGFADLEGADRAMTKGADIRFQLAATYTGSGAFQKAIDQYTLWIDNHEEEARLLTAYGGRCRARALLGSDLDKGLKDCDAAQRRGSKAVGLHVSRAIIYLRQGVPDRAISEADLVLTAEPRNAWALYARGKARLAKGMKSEGESDLAGATAAQSNIGDEAQRFGVAAPTR